MNANDLLERVKDNLIVSFNEDDVLISSYITVAIDYAESYQHLEAGYYLTHEPSETTKQGIVMLASHFYESRDGSTGGFYADNVNASEQVWKVVNSLFRLNREWKV